MKTNYPYLKDEDFLKEIDESQVLEHYSRIFLLDWDEEPIKEIQGLITAGTLNIDGASAVRRTGNISVVLEDNDYAKITKVDNLFSLNKKIFIEVGYKNITNKYLDYNMIWFPLGTFVINNISSNHSTTGTTLNINFKDKMCLLNGDCGGIIPASTQFDEYETIDEKGNYYLDRPLITKIIYELVNHFGGEQPSKIIISDLDSKVKQCMKWTGTSPIYIINRENTGQEKTSIFTLDFNDIGEGDIYEVFEYGDDIGYIFTDFTYPGELLASPGESITSVLDKIKNILGNYEYFYDIEGNFVFQEIKNYLNISQSTNIISTLNNNDYYVYDIAKGKAVFDFTKTSLITSYSNNPAYAKIKNDYIVWGTRKTSENTSVPIRYHLAIDNKPRIGNTYRVYIYTDPEDNLKKATVPVYYNSRSDFPTKGAWNVYYAVIEDEQEKLFVWNGDLEQYVEIEDAKISDITTTDWRTELYLQGAEAQSLGLESNYYYAELAAEWPKLFDIENGYFYPEVLKNPAGIDYFLDFIDSASDIGAINVNTIGRRTLALTDTTVNCVFEPTPSDIVFIEAGRPDTEEKRQECIDRSQRYCQVDSAIYNLLATGGTKNSAFVRVCDELYQCTSYNESIQISTLPLYHLEANTMISAFDEESDINGNYMIKSLSIPLTYNGTVNISANRALNKI